MMEDFRGETPQTNTVYVDREKPLAEYLMELQSKVMRRGGSYEEINKLIDACHIVNDAYRKYY